MYFAEASDEEFMKDEIFSKMLNKFFEYLLLHYDVDMAMDMINFIYEGVKEELWNHF